MNRIEGLGGVLPSILQDDSGSPGMLGEERSQVVDLAVDDAPAIRLGVVLRAKRWFRVTPSGQ